jgi:tetratricopeptide (TPR) repeat protein
MLAVFCALALGALPAHADADGGEDAGAASPASVAAPLVGDPAEELDRLLSRLTGDDPGQRQVAMSEVERTDARFLPAVAARLDALKRAADRQIAWSIMYPPKARGAALDKHAEPRSADALERVMTAPRPADEGWRNVVSTLFLARILAHIGTTPAVRELVGIYEGYGEALRADIEQQIKAVGDRAIPALIELRRGDSRELRIFSVKLLELINKSVPGEAVQTADNSLLAEILRAYGKTKDADAAGVIVAFANSERAEVRQAAREAALLLGDTGLFATRPSYERLVGKKPPADWGWEKVAKELFAAYDRARFAELYTLLDEGLDDFRAGSLESMADAYDRVLARAPSFERRKEMVPGFIAYAKSIRESDGPRAMAVLRRALRIDPDGQHAREAESELRYLEALEWKGHGLADEAGLRRALELDPNNADAKAALGKLVLERGRESHHAWRYALFAVVVAIALAAIAVFLLRRRQVAVT